SLRSLTSELERERLPPLSHRASLLRAQTRNTFFRNHSGASGTAKKDFKFEISHRKSASLSWAQTRNSRVTAGAIPLYNPAPLMRLSLNQQERACVSGRLSGCSSPLWRVLRVA